jgi:biopolymer transport protein TolQ
MNVFELIGSAGLVVKLVLWVLLVCSVLSWSVIASKAYVLRLAVRETAAFVAAFESGAALPKLGQLAKTLPHSPLAGIFLHALTVSDDLSPERLKSSLARSTTQHLQKLQSHLIILATVGSSAPFVGLFGTVWGIINAFQRIAQAGSASLAVVAPGIAEALVATAVGLAVAIPAVVGYNHLMHQASRLAEETDAVSSQLQELVTTEPA